MQYILSEVTALIDHCILAVNNQPRGSGEEDFLRFLPYMDIVAILVMRLKPF